MRAAVLTVPDSAGSRPLVIMEVPDPELVADDVPFDVIACAVC